MKAKKPKKSRLRASADSKGFPFLGRREKTGESLRQAAERGDTLTTGQAAAMTGYDRDHISLMVRRGLLNGSRPGRDWFVDARSLLNYVIGQPRPGRKRNR